MITACHNYSASPDQYREVSTDNVDFSPDQISNFDYLFARLLERDLSKKTLPSKAWNLVTFTDEDQTELTLENDQYVQVRDKIESYLDTRQRLMKILQKHLDSYLSLHQHSDSDLARSASLVNEYAKNKEFQDASIEIQETIDDLLEEGNFEICNEYLKKFDPESVHSRVLLSILMSTGFLDSELPYRKELLKAAPKRFYEDFPPGDAKAILSRLQR